MLGDQSISSGSEGSDTGEVLLADGADGSGSLLLDVLGNQSTSGSSDSSDLVGSGVPGSGSSVSDSWCHLFNC